MDAKKRIQINTNISNETRRQIGELKNRYDYSLRDVITLGIEKLYQEKIGGTTMSKQQYTYTFNGEEEATQFARAARRDGYPARKNGKNVITDSGTYYVTQTRRGTPRAIKTDDPQGI